LRTSIQIRASGTPAAQHSDDLLSERTLCCKAHITDLDESARQNAKKGAGSGIAVIFHRGGIYYKIAVNIIHRISFKSEINGWGVKTD
jgi:hypothetical protein